MIQAMLSQIIRHLAYQTTLFGPICFSSAQKKNRLSMLWLALLTYDWQSIIMSLMYLFQYDLGLTDLLCSAPHSSCLSFNCVEYCRLCGLYYLSTHNVYCVSLFRHSPRVPHNEQTTTALPQIASAGSHPKTARDSGVNPISASKQQISYQTDSQVGRQS